MSAPRARAGFTLLEVVAALALTGLAASLIAGSVSAAVQVRERQAETAEAEHRARVTRELVREAVRGLAREREGSSELIVLYPGAGEASDRLLLATHGGAVFGWDASLKAVELLVDADPVTARAGLVARVLRPVSDGFAVDTLALLPEVEALQVRLLDASGVWQEEWPEAHRAPRAVELRLRLPEGADGRLARLPLRVNLP